MLFLPEISLAFQFEKLLRAQLPSTISIHSFHSGTALKQKRLLWQDLLEKKPVLIIGVHVPILLPIENLGLIIIDEEHEVGYQEKKHPKINTKEAALLRAQITNIPILLGSATPSIASLNQVQQKKWHFFQLTKRFAGTFPTVKTVLLNEKKERKNFWVSDELVAAIKDRLTKKEQSIIFINRRGHSFFVQCKQCSLVFSCGSCSVSLTLHDPDKLHCHYCDFAMHLPQRCTGCQAKGDQFLKKGIGTQQVVTILEKLFPTARIGRADLDVSTKKNLWKQTLTEFERGDIDILVGTQTITKGYHFPKVTLVGILWADLNLHFPVYNASETTLQQLIQVAGRAGRATQESLVIVQAMINHPTFAYLNEINYPQFYDYEIALRQATLYPPCIRLIELELKHTNDDIIDAEAAAVVDMLLEQCQLSKLPIVVLGPAKPAVFKIKNVVSRKIYLKGNDINQLIMLFRTIDQERMQSRIYFTPNPGS
jgi:primosomal protein N' (replication factor Y)